VRTALIWALRIGVAAGVCAWVFYSADWGAVGDAIARVPAGAVAAAIACYGIATLIGTARLQLLLKAQGAACSFGFAFQLTYVGLCFNLALPGGNGGDVVKVGWATRVTGSFAKSIAAAGMDRGVGLICITLFAAAPALAAISDPAYRLPGIVCGAVLGVVVVAATLYFLPPVRRLLEQSHAAQGRVARAFGAFDQAVVQYRTQPKVLAFAMVLSVAGQALVIAAIWILGAGLGLLNVNYFLVIPAVMIIMAVPLAPGGVGQAEWAFAELLTAPGIDVPGAQALALAVCFRGLLVLFGLAGGVVLLFARSGGSATGAAIGGVESVVLSDGDDSEDASATAVGDLSVDTTAPAPDSSAP